MRKSGRLGILVLTLGLVAPALARQDEPAPEDPAHQPLRTLRRDLVEAINKGDLDALLKHLDENVVVTWADGRVSRTPQGVREYIEQMTRGPDRRVDSYRTEPEVEDLARLYGDTGVAFGRSQDRFVMTNGEKFMLNTRWTATLVKRDGDWRLAAFHASVGVFDNPVLNLAVRRTAIWTALAAGALGLGIGITAAYFWSLRRGRGVDVPAPRGEPGALP